jgi:hypothetical protein
VHADLIIVDEHTAFMWMRHRYYTHPSKRRRDDPEYEEKLNEWYKACENDIAYLQHPNYDWTISKDVPWSGNRLHYFSFLLSIFLGAECPFIWFHVLPHHPCFQQLAKPLKWYNDAMFGKTICMLAIGACIYGYCFYTVINEKLKEG